MSTQMRVLVGTRKGGFIYTPDATRTRWEISQPILPGWTVYHMAGDLRGREPRFFAAANHWAWGRSVAKSDDLGATWDYRSTGLGFAPDAGKTVQNVWHVTPGHPSEPGVVYAGTQPAGLFRSQDHGHTWAPVEGLNRHSTSGMWSMTGGGDSCLHSIEIDPRDARHLYAAISSGGSYESKDRGDTWSMISHTAVPQTELARAITQELIDTFPAVPRPDDMDPLAIDEMHKMRIDVKDPDRIWAQAHMGVFRSDDAGATWEDVTHTLPSFHGFPIAVTRRAPDAAFIVPLAFAGMNDNFRVCPGQFTVYRTRDRGATWQPLTEGLPGPNDYQSVYREGLDTDGLDPEGVYVGTSNGHVYASSDGGDHWQELPGRLPPVLSVSCVVW